MTNTDTIWLDLPASHKYLNALGASIAAVLERAEDLADAATTCYNVQLAVHEICTNIVEHAYEGASGGRVAVALTLAAAPQRLVVELRDTGKAFEPAQAAEPDLEDVQIHGYGLFLARSLMDEVSYQRERDGNLWQLVKFL